MRIKPETNGFILIDKPKNWTSFDIVNKLRRIAKIKKIGHAGTLDPIATGLLIVAIGRKATKQIDKYVKLDKVYEAQIKLGYTSATYDAEGELEKQSEKVPSKEEITKAIEKFIGNLKQLPPMYSAKKVNGQKLYNLARKGIEIKRKPNNIRIFSINILKYSYPDLILKVQCSSGTYIRSLAHDIGNALGVGGYISVLRRTMIGKYFVEKAYDISFVNSSNWEELITGMD